MEEAAHRPADGTIPVLEEVNAEATDRMATVANVGHYISIWKGSIIQEAVIYNPYHFMA